MEGFVDETIIEVASGKGGAGCVSFRREKFVPYGGPDGGDGGRGGDVIFTVKQNLRTLSKLKLKRVFKAQNGQPGMGKKMHGKDGESVVIAVPPGTVVKDADTQEVLLDFSTTEDATVVVFTGGKGGQGNWHFRTSVKQAPKYAQPGLPGMEARLKVELNIIADIGFVGFPNAGKSTLLGMLTNANPKIAPYPFTTKIPNLGYLNYKDHDIILADIPGIIEGAAEGKGLGLKFLKHISRTRGLVFLVDLSEEGFEERFPALLKELEEYAPELLDKPRVVFGTKTDLDLDGSLLEALKKSLPREKVFGINNFMREELEKVREIFLQLVLQVPE